MIWNELNSRKKTNWEKLAKKFAVQQWIILKEDPTKTFEIEIWFWMFISCLNLSREN